MRKLPGIENEHSLDFFTSRPRDGGVEEGRYGRGSRQVRVYVKICRLDRVTKKHLWAC